MPVGSNGNVLNITIRKTFVQLLKVLLLVLNQIQTILVILRPTTDGKQLMILLSLTEMLGIRFVLISKVKFLRLISSCCFLVIRIRIRTQKN